MSFRDLDHTGNSDMGLQLAAIEGMFKELYASAGSGGGGGDTSGLQAQIDALTARLDAVEASLTAGAAVDADLETRLAAAEAGLVEDGTALTDLGTEIDALEARVLVLEGPAADTASAHKKK